MAKMSLALSPTTRQRGLQVLLALAVLFAVDCVYQLGMHVTWRVWISRQTRALQAVASPSTQPAGKGKSSPPHELAADLRKRNIFTTPRPTGHGMRLTGVIGNMALFASREGGSVAIKEGESERGISVKSIDGYDVVIEYQGKRETMNLFAQGAGPPMPGGDGGPAMASPGQPVMARPGRPTEVRMTAPAGSGPDLSRLPPEIRERVESQMRRRQR